MKVLVTGHNGFVGRNLIATLQTMKDIEILTFGRTNALEDLKELTKECDFVFHFAGVMRPKEESEFFEGNISLTEYLCNALKENNNKAPILFTSSIHASSEAETAYSLTKREGENLIRKYGSDNDVKVFIYRLSHIFGKWSKPNYNNVTATWCYNIARGIEIYVDEPEKVLPLCYIDDVISAFLDAINGKQKERDGICYIEPIYSISLKDISKAFYSFKENRSELSVTNLSSPILKKLYSTYLSFLPENEFSYKLKMNEDQRGSFTEFFKTEDRGQVSVNISKPGIIKGNHWHHTKNEKFLVVYGTGIIRFRKILTSEVISYEVSGKKLEVVDIPCGYTHNIENIGDGDMVTIMWANELFDSKKTDTFYEEV